MTGVSQGPVTIKTLVGDSAMDEANDAVRVNVVAGSTAGTQYTEGDVDATITGTAAMMEVAANVLQPIQGTVAEGIDVDVTRLPALVAGGATIGAVTGPTADNAANPTLKLGVLPGVALAVAPTRTEGNVNPLRLNLAGDVAITLDSEAVVLGASAVNIGDVDVLTIAAGDNNIGNVDIVSGTITTVSTVTNLSQQGGVAISLNTGVRDTGTQRVTIATNDVVPVTDNAGSLTVDGTFWQATQPVSAATLPLPAGASTAALQTQPGVDIGDVTVNNASGAAAVNVQDGGNSLTIDGSINYTVPTTSAYTTAVINIAASGDNTVVAGTASQTIRVFALFFVCTAAVTITVKDGTGGASLTGAMAFAANGGMVLDPMGDPWFISAVSGAFVINLSGAVQVSGRVLYTKS